MKKIVVLGANGQLGKTIKFISKDEKDEFTFLSREAIDITNKKNLSETFKLLKFDYCVNCAAYTNVEGAEKNLEDAFSVNAEGAKNIAELCNSHGVKLIHVSTDYVFDGEKGIPYTTTDETNPINQYGKSKLKGEFYIQEQLSAYYIIRTSWLYSLYEKNFLKTIISKIENDAILNITTEEEGTPTSCTDLAEFILHIIKSDDIPYGIYNFSAIGSTTWFSFAQEIVRNFNIEKLDKILPVEKFKTLAKRPKYSVLNLKKTKVFYKDLKDWKKSINIMVEDYKNQRS